MKTENLPIKLECFSVGKNGNERTLIGFVIFPIRGVPMIYGERGRTVNIHPRTLRFIFRITLSIMYLLY